MGSRAASRRCTATTCHCRVEDVWSLISEVSQYRSWWPWLRAFDAVALAAGEEWRCEVQPPVPYLVRFGW